MVGPARLETGQKDKTINMARWGGTDNRAEPAGRNDSLANSGTVGIASGAGPARQPVG